MKNKVYVCPYERCDRAYSAHVNLKRHIDCMHLMRKNFTCPFCAKQLSSKQNFREHLYIHTGEKPFQCPYCRATFRQGSQLSQHKKIHKRSKTSQPCQAFFKLTDLLVHSSDLFFNPSALRPCYKCDSSGSDFQLPHLREEKREKVVIEASKGIFF